MRVDEFVQVVQFIMDPPKSFRVIIGSPSFHVLPASSDCIVTIRRILLEYRSVLLTSVLNHFRRRLNCEWYQTKERTPVETNLFLYFNWFWWYLCLRIYANFQFANNVWSRCSSHYDSISSLWMENILLRAISLLTWTALAYQHVNSFHQKSMDPLKGPVNKLKSLGDQQKNLPRFIIF